MKKVLGLLLTSSLLTVCVTLSAQVKNDKDWINDDPATGVYGVATNKAYDYLSSKKLKTKSSPIVAIISGGVDIEHEALAKNIWKNKAEKPDGKDNDKNGYIDDINGWNFIGGKNNSVMDNLMREGDREYFRLRSKYDGLFFDGEKYFKYNETSHERVYVDAPADMKEYKYFKDIVMPESQIGGAYNGYLLSFVLREYAHKFNDKLKVLFPDKKNYVEKDFIACWDKTGPQDSLQNVAMVIMGTCFSVFESSDWAPIFDQYKGDKQFKLAYPYYENALKECDNDNARKKIVGDDYLNINDKAYGNNIVFTANSAPATLAAGVIAGQRGIEGRNNPIAKNAKIMSLVVSANKGESFLKDIALSIRYAVDNGASIILLERQNTIYPEAQKQWVIDAIQHAESKGALVIVSTHDMCTDLSVVDYYPNRLMGQKEMSNLMVVSGSNKLGNPVLESNFSNKLVDLYAPASEIFSTYLGDTYNVASGSLLAGATVAGVAALIKTYFPTLTGSQIRNILIENCTSRKGVEVEKGIIVDERQTQDLFLFDDLCISGGIVNAYNSIVAAEKLAKVK